MMTYHSKTNPKDIRIIKTYVYIKKNEVLKSEVIIPDVISSIIERPFDLDGRMTIAVASERYGVCQSTLRKYINDGRLKHYNIGRLIFVYEDDLEVTIKTKGKWKNTRNHL